MYGVVTLEDVTQSNDIYVELFQSTDERVHSLVDLSQVDKFPLNIPQIMKAMKVARDREPGWVLIVQKPNPVLQHIATMIAQIAIKQIRLRMMKDIPSAVQFLLEQDPSLDPAAFPSPTEQETIA
jgi:hypothetical protein